MELKIERDVAIVWFKDLEDFVEDKLGIRPSILDFGEYHNDSYFEVEAIVVELNNGITDEWLEGYEQAVVDFVDGDSLIDPEYLFCFLATKKYIEPGKYLVTVWY